MKRILATSAIVALSAGFASAEVTLSGDARMGIISDFGDVDTAFTSRARVSFTLSGESDSGFSYGASFRADNAGGAASGTAGSVYISTGGLKLSMGDVDGAAQAAVGQVDGVGLTGLSDLNEIAYISSGGVDLDGKMDPDDLALPFYGSTDDPSVLLSYSAGDFTGYMSMTNPSGSADAVAVGAKYSFGDYSVSAGYERLTLLTGFDIDQLVLGASATFGAITGKVVFANLEYADGQTDDQMSVSVTYTADALALTAFYTDSEEFENNSAIFGGEEAYGLGASYDLGGGASLVGGYAKNSTDDDSAFDLGLSFSF